MPQMAPMHWIFLFIYSFTLIYIFNNLNYFIFFNKPQFSSHTSSKNIKTSWKW
uniref:ATP synthase complex subunit 8 n=1 Tax=Coniopteryx sp. YW-2016 TaxID=1821761 RepID=A0A1S5QYC1_9NEOP|nr:ATP synthase F0 subunit 8 [Coniopteryx sp. YW-2016]